MIRQRVPDNVWQSCPGDSSLFSLVSGFGRLGEEAIDVCPAESSVSPRGDTMSLEHSSITPAARRIDTCRLLRRACPEHYEILRCGHGLGESDTLASAQQGPDMMIELTHSLATCHNLTVIAYLAWGIYHNVYFS